MRRGLAIAPPDYPSFYWFDGGLRENGGSGGEKNNPFTEIRNSPALLHWLGGVGVKAVSVPSILPPIGFRRVFCGAPFGIGFLPRATPLPGREGNFPSRGTSGMQRGAGGEKRENGGIP